MSMSFILRDGLCAKRFNNLYNNKMMTLLESSIFFLAWSILGFLSGFLYYSKSSGQKKAGKYMVSTYLLFIFLFPIAIRGHSGYGYTLDTFYERVYIVFIFFCYTGLPILLGFILGRVIQHSRKR